jgi:hypothetical protein
MSVHEADLCGKTYDQVEATIKEWIGLPCSTSWKQLFAERPFYGVVPRHKTAQMYSILTFCHDIPTHSTLETIHNIPYKYFRTYGNLQHLFNTDNHLWGYRYKTLRIFITSTYTESKHTFNIELFKRLAAIWHDGRILSIKKDYTYGPESGDICIPFVRPMVAILAVTVSAS